MKVTYTGPLAVTYPAYMDLATGQALAVEPGGTYDVQAVGFGAPDIPPSDFVLADNGKAKKKEKEESFTAPEAVEEQTV